MAATSIRAGVLAVLVGGLTWAGPVAAFKRPLTTISYLPIGKILHLWTEGRRTESKQARGAVGN